MASILLKDLQVSQSDLNVDRQNALADEAAILTFQVNSTTDYDKHYLSQQVNWHPDHHAKIREHGRSLLLTYWTKNLKTEKLTTKMACHDITYPGDFKMLITTMRLEGQMNLELRMAVARQFLRAFIRHVDKYKRTTMAYFVSDTAFKIIDSEKNIESPDLLLKILDKDEQFVILSYIPEMMSMARNKNIMKDLTTS